MTEFLSRTMYDFNRMMEKYLREELGCKQLINAGNWQTADMVKLNDAERWSYTANQVLAVNRYFSGIHIGKNNGWAIEQRRPVHRAFGAAGPRGNCRSASSRSRACPMMVTETRLGDAGRRTPARGRSWSRPTSR